MMKFKLLAGLHEQNLYDADGKPTTVTEVVDGREATRSSKVYKPGDIVEHPHDLCARFNSPGMSPKFEPVQEHRRRTDRFDEMSTGELKDECAARELESTGTREDLLRTLRA